MSTTEPPTRKTLSHRGPPAAPTVLGPKAQRSRAERAVRLRNFRGRVLELIEEKWLAERRGSLPPIGVGSAAPASVPGLSAA